MTQVKSEWEFLGKGSYNKAYVNQTKTEVLKIQLDSSETDNPERSVRLWNAINSDKGLPPARIDEQRKGWICPFVSGKQANDVEMRKALIDIFNKTGRIVVDAISPKNFLKTDKGSIICVDIGLAVQLERNEEQKFIQRRKSITSLNAWDNDRDLYIPYFRDNYRTTPQTIDTIKALLFIKENHPQSYDVSFLKNNLSLTQLLSNAYFLPDQHPTKNNALGALIAAVKVQHQEIPIKYKEACTDYRDKLHKIEEIKKNTLNSPKLSPEEKKFINTVFSTLTETILNHHHDLLNIPNKTIANIETKKQETDQFIEQYLGKISLEVKTIPILSGLKGFINNMCATFCLPPPFIITNSKNINTVQEMKQTLFQERADLEGTELSSSVKPNV